MFGIYSFSPQLRLAAESGLEDLCELLEYRERRLQVGPAKPPAFLTLPFHLLSSSTIFCPDAAKVFHARWDPPHVW